MLSDGRGWLVYQLPMNGDDSARKNGSASIRATEMMKVSAAASANMRHDIFCLRT
jgi:hypothetical protein